MAWINRKWFLDNGWDALSSIAHEDVNRWILQQFAHELDTYEGAPVSANAQDQRRYVIDSYGTTSLARYGGSGRAGIVGKFQVKGIGRTPFAARDADWHHSHGCLWLEEGLREAVFSEVCRREAPCGAVPVIAVIALEETLIAPDGGSRRRALLVRPFRIRPAHLQRALLLERPDLGGPFAAHMHDADRVRWHVERLTRQSGGVQRSFDSLTTAYGRQAAYSHAYGWFNGGLTSSNLTLQGEFIDFGSARFVPDGRGLRYEAFGQRYGDELNTATAVLESVAFYLHKYASLPDARINMIARLTSSYQDELAKSASLLLGYEGPPAVAAQLADYMESAFVEIRSMDNATLAATREEKAMADCAQLLAHEGGLDPAAAVEHWHTIRFRGDVSREAVQCEIERLLTEDPQRWQVRVDHIIARHSRSLQARSGPEDSPHHELLNDEPLTSNIDDVL